MIHQPPVGARDLLPIDVAQKQWIEHGLQEVFHRWSYHRIITPTLERMETLTAGGAVQPESVIQVWDAEEGFLGLRPELTASIARAAVNRMAGATYPQRLYYAANIFRRQSGEQARGQHEFYQAGVELLGAGGISADAEVLLLLADSLKSIGLDRWHLILGDAGLTRSLLWDFPKPVRGKVRQAIACLDRIALGTLPLEADLSARALSLMDLRGNPGDVLQQVSQWHLDETQQTAVHRLKSVMELVEGHPSVILDLSLIQPFNYYTGIVFEVVSDSSSQRVLGQGGRYDQLLSLYHPQGQIVPGIGFSLNIQDLQQVLLATDRLPQQTRSSHWLVVAESNEAISAAFRHANELRCQGADTGVRVEVALELDAVRNARDYAQHRSIPKIAWVNPSGSVTIETVLPS